jgi:aminopeptidase N
MSVRVEPFPRWRDRRRAAVAVQRPFLAACLVALAGCAAPGLAPSPDPSPAPDVMQPGISLDLARHRAATLADVRYRLHLDVTGRDTARGQVRVAFTRSPAAGDLVLDFRGPVLTGVRANGVAIVDAEWRAGHLRIPAAHLAEDETVVEAAFAALIAEAGASIIRYDDATDGSTYLYTLLVPADANQLFPSFDQPDLKARFRVSIAAPSDWTVLANGPLERTETGTDDATVWHFAETEPISTYLAAFAAGPWHTWESAPPGELPITLYARRSRADEVDADTLIRTNRESVGWLERYFGLPFPFAKFDMLLAPAFPFGGMEHVGAVFYNENQFVFREPPTLNQRLARNATIYHEVAHQWFGDLVTMRWFDDLWLKEGFSTWASARMQEDLNPGAEAWKTFFLRNKPLAYGTDATSGTTPVWQTLPNLDLAKGNYGPIVYNKAPAVIRQLEYLVGDEPFRAGLRLFLTRHAYGNADWRDLLAAIEETSGQSLQAFGEQYILRAGMPVVETELTVRGGRIQRLALRQRPARALPDDPGGWWPGRVRLRLHYPGGDDVLLPVAFDGEVTEVAAAAGLPAPAYAWANDGDFGYGLFLLDPASADGVARGIGRTDDGLLRAMLWVALWDLVRERRMDPARFVELALREMPAEADEQIASAVLGRAATALERYLDDGPSAALAARWEALLLSRADDAALSYGARKAALDAFVATARTPAGRAVLRTYLDESRTFDGAPVQQATRWSIAERLAVLAEPDAAARIEAEAARDQTPDSPRRAFIAGAGLVDPAEKAAYFGRYLDDPRLNEEWVTSSLGNFNAPEHQALSLPYLRPALERLEWVRDNRRIFFLPRWINAFVGGHSSPEALSVVDAFLDERPRLSRDVRLKLLQARDELERTVRIRAGAGG